MGDAGLDGGRTDAGSDAGIDGGVDAGVEPDAGRPDAGQDGGPDAGIFDAGSDAGPDAGALEPDAGGPMCPPVIADQICPYTLAIDQANVYFLDFWNDLMPGSVMSVPLAGGSPAALAVLPIEGPLGFADIAASDGTVCWADVGPQSGNIDAGTVTTVADDGGDLTPIASGILTPTAVAIDSTHIYWANGWTAAFSPTGSVWRALRDGGSPEQLAASQNYPSAIALDDTSVYWANSGTGTDPDTDGSIMRLLLDGGTPTALATGQSYPTAITVANGVVYWTDLGTEAARYADGTVKAIDLTSGQVTTLAVNEPGAGPIAVNSVGIYWEDTYGGDDQVRRLSFDAGSLDTLADGGWFYGIAANDQCVYFVNRGSSINATGCAGGMIESLPK